MYYPVGMGALGCCAGAMGDEAPETETVKAGSATSWISGGLLVALAVTMFVLDTKDPLGLKRSTSS
jgi:hypothetical protein